MQSALALEKLFEPGSIGTTKVRNRFYMSPMGDRYGRDGYVTDQMIRYYEARAKGGVGMVIVGCSGVAIPEGVIDPIRTFVDDDKYIPGLTRLAEAIRRTGARAAIQIGHAGARGDSPIQPVAPSSVQHPTHQHPIPRALSIPEIEERVDQFVRAAVRVKKAGFDGLELHAAHGMLLSNFLSPTWNKREDEYGGSVENRARIVVEALNGIRQMVGRDYPVWVRINGHEPGVPGGLTIAEAQAIAVILEKNGANAVDVSKDTLGINSMPQLYAEGGYLEGATAVKKVVGIPVLASGRMSPQFGEATLRQGGLDFVGMGRMLIADPELVNKLAAGRPEDIVPCLSCCKCFGQRRSWDVIVSHGGIQCTVNPMVGREGEQEISPVAKPKRVLVVGAGPAGMKAAQVTAQRGHQVTLYDKSERLGGMMTAAAIPPYKERINDLTKYFDVQLKKLNVAVSLGSEVMPELVAEIKPDVAVVGVGAKPALPSIAGIRGEQVVLADDVLLGRAQVGQTVVVIGGGEVGAETAETLADQGKNVTIVEMLDEIAPTMNWIYRRAILRRLPEKKVRLLTGTKCKEVAPGSVTVERKDGTPEIIPADNVVLAVGTQPNRELAESLQGLVPEVYTVGDCAQPRSIMDAIKEGADVARAV